MIVLGFGLFSLFVVLLGIFAVIFVSFDERYNINPLDPHATLEVRRVSTTTIETVDSSGHVQRWRRD